MFTETGQAEESVSRPDTPGVEGVEGVFRVIGEDSGDYAATPEVKEK